MRLIPIVTPTRRNAFVDPAVIPWRTENIDRVSVVTRPLVVGRSIALKYATESLELYNRGLVRSDDVISENLHLQALYLMIESGGREHVIRYPASQYTDTLFKDRHGEDGDLWLHWNRSVLLSPSCLEAPVTADNPVWKEFPYETTSLDAQFSPASAIELTIDLTGRYNPDSTIIWVSGTVSVFNSNDYPGIMPRLLGYDLDGYRYSRD